MISKFFKFSLVLIFVSVFVSCAAKNPENFDDEKALYDYSLELYKQKNWSESARFFETFKNKYSTSPYIADAEFKLGESYFNNKDYIEAIYAFQNFKYLHPTNPNAALATFRIAESYFKQIPRTIDRDQTNTLNSISSMKELIGQHPDFEQIDEVKKMLGKCERMLAERELYVANFYFKQRSYKAALGRLETVKKDFEFKDLRQEAIYKLALSYNKLQERDKSIENLNALLQMDPDSSYRKKANKLIAKINSAK